LKWRASAAPFVVCATAALVSCKLLASYEEVEYAPDVGVGGNEGGADGGVDEGGCLVPTPTTLFSTGNSLSQLYTSNGRLFIELDDTNNDRGVLACDPNDCTQPKTLIAPITQLGSSAPGPDGVYYTLSSAMNADDGGPDYTGEIDLVGDAGKKLVASGLGFSYLLGVAQEGTFYTDDPQNPTASSSGESSLNRVADGGSASWFGGMFSTYQVAIGSSRVFVLADTSSATVSTSVFACSLQAPCGKSPKVVATEVDGTQGSIAVDGDTLFYAQSSSLSIFKVGTDGGATAIATAQSTPTNLLVDGDYVYWIADTQMNAAASTFVGDVRRTKKDGTGTVERVVCGLSSPSLLTSDADHLYFSTSDANATATVLRADKPR
jgi:hypothetical protein